ncbi:UNVERIFIED_CONTAM: hypothetical protein Slati_0467900 [Sesamum latifolium]|uniref:Aminotransferase-like plant mobile domain-containing protein n=1 Tax=Sesamum latifolium TaxID=2727402 RepID=A0AAW2XWQ3_9LAMI
MVYFKDKSSPSGEHHLIILDDQHQPIEKGTMLAVYTPLVSGRNVNPWPRLTNSFYLDEWSQEVSLNKNVKAWTLRATHHELPRHQQSNDLIPLRSLGRSIVEGDAKWDGDLQFIGDFHYTKGYWEWTEDVLSRVLRSVVPTYKYFAYICRRVVHLTVDLHDLAGLPITGCLYDEVVPSALELTGADEKGGRFIPCSSKYLLYAYHLLQGADDDRCSNVSIDKWVKFWSKKTIKYHLPPPRKEKKTVRPKSTHNPLGDITTHKRWSTVEEALFEKLCIEGNLKEEVFLAAYLACWLCTFILPSKDVNSIRPSTFKMASMMASGRRHLTSRLITRFGKDCVAKKMTRFSGEGGAKYYDPQEARKRIHKAEFVSWACNMIVKNRPFKTNSLLSPIVLTDLSVNLGTFKIYPGFSNMTHVQPLQKKDSVIGAYVFYQNLRQKLGSCPKPTKITIKCKKYEDEQVDGENNPPYVPVPSIVVKSNSQAVAVEASKGKGSRASASRSPSADFVAQLEDEIQSVDASEESETSDSWTTTPPPFGMGLKGKQLPQPPAASVLEGESFVCSHHKEFLQKMWSDLLVKISNTPVDFLSSIEDDVSLILKSMKNFHKFDITPVEESLNTFFVKVRAYDEARSLSSQKLSRSLHEQYLKEAKARLQDVQAKASEGASKVQSIVDELEHVEKKIVALKGRRTSLCAALKEQKQLNHDAQAKVHEVEEDIATLDNTAPFDDAIVED